MNARKNIRLTFRAPICYHKSEDGNFYQPIKPPKDFLHKRPPLSMTFQHNLEINGTLRRHSPAELFAEISAAKLNGSLRLSNAETAQKTVVYFDAGDAVFAVSNARRFRLFETLLSANKITKEQLAATPDFTDDLALRANLIASGALSKADADALVAKQIELILADALERRAAEDKSGEWVFSPLVRIKGDVRFAVDATALLLAHARGLPEAEIAARLEDARESFAVKESMPVHINLLPEEAFVFSRFETSKLSVDQAKMFAGLPAPAALKIVYTLWLGGFLARENWDAPFSARSLAAISAANLTLKKSAASVSVDVVNTENKTPETVSVAPKNNLTEQPEKIALARGELTLEKYLERIDTARSFYDFFAVEGDAPVAEIKRGYLSIAKRFHPDLFRRETDADKIRQIQDAFTRIAQAYETLKNERSREIYDYKIRKELIDMKAERAIASTADAEERGRQMRTEQAANDFERGFNFLMDGEPEEALPFFARAAHLNENNARYRAYYGKALAADGVQKHKAEAELQAAMRLAPENADVRLMLAEFFIQMNLPKRAEGELRRLLAIFPSNTEAEQLLDSLAKR